MAWWTFRVIILGIQTVLLLHYAQSYVLLSADMKDVKRIAEQLAAQPIVESIKSFIRSATQQSEEDSSTEDPKPNKGQNRFVTVKYVNAPKPNRTNTANSEHEYWQRQKLQPVLSDHEEKSLTDLNEENEERERYEGTGNRDRVEEQDESNEDDDRETTNVKGNENRYKNNQDENQPIREVKPIRERDRQDREQDKNRNIINQDENQPIREVKPIRERDRQDTEQDNNSRDEKRNDFKQLIKKEPFVKDANDLKLKDLSHYNKGMSLFLSGATRQDMKPPIVLPYSYKRSTNFDIGTSHVDTKFRSGINNSTDSTTVKERTGFDQYDNNNYPRFRDLIATSGPVALPKMTERNWWEIALPEGGYIKSDISKE